MRTGRPCSRPAGVKHQCCHVGTQQIQPVMRPCVVHVTRHVPGTAAQVLQSAVSEIALLDRHAGELMQRTVQEVEAAGPSAGAADKLCDLLQQCCIGPARPCGSTGAAAAQEPGQPPAQVDVQQPLLAVRVLAVHTAIHVPPFALCTCCRCNTIVVLQLRGHPCLLACTQCSGSLRTPCCGGGDVQASDLQSDLSGARWLSFLRAMPSCACLPRLSGCGRSQTRPCRSGHRYAVRGSTNAPCGNLPGVAIRADSPGVRLVMQ